ncbi:MAG: class I SAM-dependent DNA methyltransferase [Saprospiraceae bacterium]|jgi:adenine-specific DNA-methyltransferase|nr:class I SAM-dependent DNA methyltransferase [Saprospiraceae bacterium]
MNSKALKPRQALNKAYLKVKPSRSDIEGFKAHLIQLLDRSNDKESEEFHKNLVSDFLKDTYYKKSYFINTKGRNDLVVHNGADAQSTVGVIIEAKKPTNKAEMVSQGKLNSKAFQELVLYYLKERITHKNIEVRHLVITNIYEWYIFDATLFDRYFAQNKALVKQYLDFEAGRLAESKTDFFYKQIAEPAIADLKGDLEYTYFDLRNYQKAVRNTDKDDDNQLIALYKLLSPEHLLKLPFANDSNSLDKRFYSELLHIIGLTESKEGSKKLIGRHKEADRQLGTLLESTINQLDAEDRIRRIEKPGQFGANLQERLYNVALELTLTWINRILFLKLLEAQLISYHKGDKAYAFLNGDKIKSYDDLNGLFFQVLARKHSDRQADVKAAFDKVPYLNSSLFEPTDIEQTTLFISNLRDDRTIPIFGQTVLKDDAGKKRSGQLSTLDYLFQFLDAYDFGSEGSEDIQEDNKSLINASVLGLIFEKINGYKDGSFFTPGFITMYMCRETIRRAVVQKFNEAKQWNCENFDELYDKIEDRTEANNIVNSLHICDPAVGSGHFLVSALNEVIAVKNDLKILQDRDGKRLKEYHVEVVNDELIITDDDGGLFEYKPGNKESQRIQETLFHEKQTIIENCLFGVDINPNSVKICRLRLWIELLKNAYYKNATELETLPNIDINIKCGNSLVSRFAIDADLGQALKKSKWTIDDYRIFVNTYRNAENKEQKREMEQLIETIKSDFRSEISKNDPKLIKLSKLKGDLFNLTNQTSLFALSDKEKAAWEKQIKKLQADIIALEKEIEEIKANKIYENAFEWRFEFPEVLNAKGDFVGFDVVIGNPPYFSMTKLKEQSSFFDSAGYLTYSKSSDIYCLFYERGIQLLKYKGILTFITSNSWLRTQYGQLLRKYLVEKTNPLQLLNIEDIQIFEDATVESNIIEVEKSEWNSNLKAVSLKSNYEPSQSLEEYFKLNSRIISSLSANGWTIGNEAEGSLKTKIENNGIALKKLNYQIYYGLKTGFNEAFYMTTQKKDELIKEDESVSSFFKKALRGKDISKYNYGWNDIWLLLIKQGMTNGQKPSSIKPEDYFSNIYPTIYNHLKNIGDSIKGKGKGLYARDDQGDYWWELRPCVYYEEFEKPKIVWGELSDSQKFAYDESGMYTNNTIFFITGKDLKFLLSILNSKLAKWYFNEISTSSGMGTNRWLKYKIELLPIIQPSEKEKATLEKLVEHLLLIKTLNPKADVTDLENQIDQIMYETYGLTEEEIKIVEEAK